MSTIRGVMTRVELLLALRAQVNASLRAELARQGQAFDYGEIRRRAREAACGTEGGYYRHLRTTKTDPCEPCKEAHSIEETARARRRKMRIA